MTLDDVSKLTEDESSRKAGGDYDGHTAQFARIARGLTALAT